MEEGQQLRRRSISPPQNQDNNIFNSNLIKTEDSGDYVTAPLLEKNAPEGGLHSSAYDLKRMSHLANSKALNSFVDNVKQKIQVTFRDVVIRTTARRRRFYDRSNEIPETKIILNNVSGTILPGQFVSIMGASGKFFMTILLLKQVLEKQPCLTSLQREMSAEIFKSAVTLKSTAKIENLSELVCLRQPPTFSKMIYCHRCSQSKNAYYLLQNSSYLALMNRRYSVQKGSQMNSNFKNARILRLAESSSREFLEVRGKERQQESNLLQIQV